MKKPELKLCGNRSVQDWGTVRMSGADYAGFIFAPSKRRVTDEQVANWLSDYPPESIKIVGVFVNPELEDLAETVSKVPLDILQLHGKETPVFAAKVKQMTGKPIWKVLHHGEDAQDDMLLFRGIADGYVVDTKLPGQWGGTGKRFDWGAIPGYQTEANEQHVPLFIAGGINPDNVNELLKFHPDGIDVSSGIESSEQKDEYKIKRMRERLG
ncbi:phosphoribosylanthranilate isomerase [Pseudalkalibacillus hwajinpoensis]|uniref:phosphoribosylanthranilate isomerase n=1 Tax=Guptibacillus hwajinpoensis TaxID=208199 RepID=UPI00325BD75B